MPLCVPLSPGIFLTLYRLYKSETKAQPPLAVGTDTPAIPAGHLEPDHPLPCSPSGMGSLLPEYWVIRAEPEQRGN